MARAYQDTAPYDFQTFDDQRYLDDDPRYAPAPYAPEPEQNWWEDEAYQRSDIVLESHTDPTGWGAHAIAGRPPAEATSGNRLLVILLFLAGLAPSVALWLFETEAGAINDVPSLMIAIGRITGLAGGYLLFIQLLMMSRVSWLEEGAGATDTLKWNRGVGRAMVVPVLAHAVFITCGFALTAESPVVEQGITIITTLPDMLSATAATGLLVLISLMSVRVAKNKLPYELWHLIHLSGY